MNARANRQLSASPHTAVLNVNAQHCSMHWQRCCLSSHGGTAVCCAKPGLGFHNLQAASHAKSGVAAGCQTSCGHSLVAWPRAPSVPLRGCTGPHLAERWTRSAGMHSLLALAAGIVSRARGARRAGPRPGVAVGRRHAAARDCGTFHRLFRRQRLSAAAVPAADCNFGRPRSYVRPLAISLE